MEKDNIIADLKKNFKNIYESPEKRVDCSEWEKMVKKPYNDFPEETAEAAAEFAMTHRYMPSAAVRSLLQAVKLRDHPSFFSALYSEKITQDLMERMVKRDPVRYALIPDTLPEKEVQDFLDAAKAARLCLDKRQVYLAEMKIAEAEKIYSGHADIALMRARLCALKFDFSSAERFLKSLPAGDASPEAYELAGDIWAARKYYPQAYAAYQKAREISGRGSGSEILDRKAEYAAERSEQVERMKRTASMEMDALFRDAERQMRSGDLSGAAKTYEAVIEKDYRRFEAYYPLGCIFLRKGKKEQADYLAELLLDFDADRGRARLLKGMVLEASGKTEDALFYYNAAARECPQNAEILCQKKRLTAVLDGDEDESARAGEIMELRHGISVRADSGKKSGHNTEEEGPEGEKRKKIRQMDEDIVEILARGRMTEAYYELIRKSSEYPDSSVLLYRKAVILYLMNRDAEAREILVKLRREKAFEEKVQNFICDIDCRIVGEHRESDIPADLLPEVLFNAGKTEECREAIGKIREEKLTPELTALRGRCEIEGGHFSDALKSFTSALKADENLRGIRVLAGMILQSKRDYDGALRMYDEALKFRENPREVCSIKASLLYDQERNAELLVFRSDVENMGISCPDVDGYAGLVYIERTPHDEKKGLSYLERAVGGGSANAKFYAAAARAYMEEERRYAALTTAEAGLCAAPSDRELFLLKAEILFLLGKWKAAEMVAGTLLSENLEAGELHYLLGKIESEKGNQKDALRWLKSAADLEPENHRYIYAYADKCFETGDRRNAEIFYTKAIGLDPQDYISLKRRAIIREEGENDEGAIADIRAVLRMRPNDAEAYVILGNIISSYDIEEEAENVKEGAREKEPDAEKQESAAENGEADGSDTAERHVSLEENPFEAVAKIADEYYASPEYYYEKAIRIDPKYRQSYISLAKLRAESGRYDEAEQEIEKAIALDPEMTDGYMVRGIIRHLQGDNDAAISDFREIVAREPKNLRAYSYISKCCNAAGRYAEAVEAAERGLEINGDYVNLYVNRGVALYHMKRYEEAVEAFKKVITNQNAVNTAALESSYHFRGMAYEKLGNVDRAVSDYQKLLRYNPDRKEIKKHLEELQEQIEEEKPKSRLTSLFGKKGRKR